MNQSIQRICLYILHASVTLFYAAISIVIAVVPIIFCDNGSTSDCIRVAILFGGVPLLISVIMSVFAFLALGATSTAARFYLYFWSGVAFLVAVFVIISPLAPFVLFVIIDGIWTIYYAYKYVRKSDTTNLGT